MTTKKQPSRRTNSSKTAPKKTVAKNFATTRAKKVTPRKTAAKKTTTPTSSSAVKLPNNMSQRAIEKSIVYKREFDDHYRRSMYRVAYVTGLCFILIGASYAGSALHSDIVPPTQMAQLSKSFSTTTNSFDTSIIQNEETTEIQPIDDSTTNQTLTQSEPTIIPDAKIRLIDPLPQTVDDDLTLNAEAVYTNRLIVKVKAISPGSGFMPDPSVEERSNNRYRFTIPASKYSPGAYQLLFIADGVNGRVVNVPSGFFKVPSNNTGTSLSYPDTIDISANNDTAADLGNPDLVDITIDDDTGLVAIDDFQADEPDFVDPSPVIVDFSIFKSATVLSGIETIGVNAPEDYSYIELYARPAGGTNARFVGLASTRFNRWQFVLDTNKLTNGEYDFFAQTKNTDGDTLTTKPLRLRISNTNTSLTSESEPTVEEVREPLQEPVSSPEFDGERESILPVRTFELENEQDTEDPKGEQTESDEVPERLIRENRESLEELYKSFTEAKISGDEDALEKAREDLRAKRREIANTINTEADEEREKVEQEITERIEDFEDRVTRFEGIRKERIARSEAAAEDTDGDGISDVDERELYGTDPDNSDSDDDGVPDGIELVRGLNPRGETPDDIIRFESPKETLGLQRDDEIVVSQVNSITKDTDVTDQGEALVRTEIRGKALPNSFVTLYIFSSPTVVTIKTDADGSFVYTFDKELEDGQHDVYAAVTDNTGEIVAQSAPFSFIKRAEAFTPVDAAEAEVVSTETIVDNAARGYNVAVGIGILALGLILLMLGIGLRTKDDELEKNTVKVGGEDVDAQSQPAPVKRIEHIDAS